MGDTVLARRRWAYAMMARCTEPAPAYGTQAWLDLPEGDPAKVAAVIHAAENWAQDGDELEERLRYEVNAARAAFKATEDAEYVARRDAHRAEREQVGHKSHPAHLRLIDGGTPTSPGSGTTDRGRTA